MYNKNNSNDYRSKVGKNIKYERDKCCITTKDLSYTI